MGQCANTIPWIVNYALTAFFPNNLKYKPKISNANI